MALAARFLALNVGFVFSLFVEVKNLLDTTSSMKALGLVWFAFCFFCLVVVVNEVYTHQLLWDCMAGWVLGSACV
jgi:hypothetical protein